MARFYTFNEIQRGLILTAEQITALATKIQKLPAFQEGHAVVYGSVAWGDHSWRSDLDIAFGGIDNYYLREEKEEVGHFRQDLYSLFKSEFGSDGRLILNSLVQILQNESEEEGVPVWETYGRSKCFGLSPSTRDHFRLLAEAKGGDYQKFYDQYVKYSYIRGQRQLYDFWEYAYDMFWNAGRNRRVTEDSIGQLEILASFENFPKQLIRKYLGYRKMLPVPDTFPNILKVWNAEGLIFAERTKTLFPPFFEIKERYEEIVEKVKQGRLKEYEYYQSTSDLFENLPIHDVCHSVLRCYKPYALEFGWYSKKLFA